MEMLKMCYFMSIHTHQDRRECQNIRECQNMLENMEKIS